MFKNIFYTLTIILSIIVNAQVGVNTNSPQGIFHVNANSANDPNNNSKTDDVVISTTTGNVGIGLTNPDTKLHINTNGTPASPVPGFKLTDGNQAEGKVLQTNANGVATWKNFTMFYREPIVGSFTWPARRPVGTTSTSASGYAGNTNWNSISNISLAPGTYMIYIKVHMLNTPDTGFLRTYVGTKGLGSNNSNAAETPILGSTNFQPFINKDFEMTQSFVYTNTTANNVTIYFNIQSDNASVQRSDYTYPQQNSFKGVNLIENYFLAVPVN